MCYCLVQYVPRLTSPYKVAYASQYREAGTRIEEIVLLISKLRVCQSFLVTLHHSPGTSEFCVCLYCVGDHFQTQLIFQT